eukprot:TRINITY_DN14079_c0_g1_i2.p1 TRINITY_DN14079_c0_g1~~TRINITY_DN14079_c0_g1_i2.p1  ORF type:complete len:233 (-),score=40.05 TRINITY_DN14079_c0_g1_i2:433-1131(-)
MKSVEVSTNFLSNKACSRFYDDVPFYSNNTNDIKVKRLRDLIREGSSSLSHRRKKLAARIHRGSALEIFKSETPVDKQEAPAKERIKWLEARLKEKRELVKKLQKDNEQLKQEQSRTAKAKSSQKIMIRNELVSLKQLQDDRECYDDSIIPFVKPKKLQKAIIKKYKIPALHPNIRGKAASLETKVKIKNLVKKKLGAGRWNKMKKIIESAYKATTCKDLLLLLLKYFHGLS